MNPAPSVIQFHCQSCGILLTVPAEMAGVTGPCPHCQMTITSPAVAPQQTSPFAPPHPPATYGGAPASAAPSSLPPPAAGGWPQHPPADATPPPPVVPVGGMAGGAWPPSPATSTGIRGSGAHPVMERLLHTQTALPSMTVPTAPSQERSSGGGAARPRRRVSSARDKGRRGAMLLAVLMAVLVLTGTSWFFRDQLKAVWLNYTMREEEASPEDAPSSAMPHDVEPANLESTASTLPKAIPLPAAPPSATDSATPVTIRPALPSTEPSPAAPGTLGLVEVPASASSSPGPPVNVVPSPPPVPALVTGVGPETRAAQEALQKFFEAKTWQERLPFVQAPDSMKPLMEQYYGANPDGPIYPSHIQMIRHDKAPETGPPHCVFQVSGGGLRQPLPLMVENTDGGWKVDWLTFTEFKDELLLKFLDSPQPEPARFHVMMRRAHYFDDDVPALDKKTCFQVMPPMPGFTGDVFALKGTPVARDLDKFMGWDVTQAAAVVELQWRQEEPYKWVELTNLVQLNWRNVEPGEKTKTGDASKSAAAERMPPKAEPVE